MVNDVVIIGGGVIGVCTAYYLSQDERFRNRSVAVTIVEANEIASGASGKAAGFLASNWHGPATAALGQLSYALHQQLAQEFDGEHVYGYRKLTSINARVCVSGSHDTVLVDPILEASGLQFRPTPPSLGHAAAQWLQGSNVENLDLISEEDTTAQVHPKLFTRTLFDNAQAHGVQYIQGRPASWDQDSKLLKVNLSDGSRDIPADTLVVTAGPWSGQVAKQLLGVDVPISDLPGHSILIRPREALPAHAVFAQVHAPDVTGTPELFVRPDGHVYVSGENSGPKLPDGTANVEIDPVAIDKLVKASAVISESLALGTVEVKQLCYRPVTPHRTPFVGALKKGTTKAYIAAGHGPWGISLAPGTGKVMAELILDDAARSALISQLQPPNCIEPLPLEPLPL